jgi:hypothetical protein
MVRLCPGYFTEKVIDVLRQDNGIAYLSQPCAKCGKHVVAINKAGQWIPETHSPPIKYKSGKSGGYKR